MYICRYCDNPNPNPTNDPSEVDIQTQFKYYVNMMLFNMANDVAASIWYLLIFGLIYSQKGTIG